VTATLVWKALAVWVAMAVSAVINGIVRQSVLVPILGEGAARPLSAAMLLILVYVLTWVFLRWTNRPTGRGLWVVGAGWLALTVIFETALGFFVSGMSAPEIAASYNPLAPTLWFYVLAGILVAPPLVARLMRS
jgi:hypothetical protein